MPATGALFAIHSTTVCRRRLVMTSMSLVVVADVFLFSFLGLLPALLDDFDVVVQNCSNDWDHIGLDNPRTHILGAANANIDNTLEGKVPFPHAHHIIATTLLQDADKTFDASVDGKNVADSCRRCGEVSEMIERVDEWQCRRAI